MKKILLLLAMCLIFSECNNNSKTNVNTNSSWRGSIIVKIITSNKSSRSHVQNMDMEMEVSSYVISGKGPNNSTFAYTINSDVDSYQLNDLMSGDWLITIDANNGNNIKIGTGLKNITIKNNSITTANIVVLPYEGTGNLQLSVTWDQNAVKIPLIKGILSSSFGDIFNISFRINNGQATYSSKIPSGYYTLKVIVLNRGYHYASTTRVVRILNNRHTKGSIHVPENDTKSLSALKNITSEQAESKKGFSSIPN